jgi:cell division protease FtsH
MVTRWGMGSLGPIAFRTDDEQPFLGYELSQPREVSPDTATRIDEDVERLIEEAHESARLALTAHRADLETVVDALMQEETLDDDRIEALLGPPLRRLTQNQDRPAETQDTGRLFTP